MPLLWCAIAWSLSETVYFSDEVQPSCPERKFHHYFPSIALCMIESSFDIDVLVHSVMFFCFFFFVFLPGKGPDEETSLHKPEGKHHHDLPSDTSGTIERSA